MHLDQLAILCPECDALWFTDDVLAANFVDYQTYMRTRGRSQPYGQGELEIRGPLVRPGGERR